MNVFINDHGVKNKGKTYCLLDKPMPIMRLVHGLSC